MHSNRLPSVAGSLLLYGLVMVAAGHGVGQVGLLLTMGWLQVWALAQLPGWIGIVLLLRALFVQESAYRPLRGWGTTLLGGSLWSFAWLSEAPALTLTTAIPFHFAWAFTVSEWLRQGPSSGQRQLSERPGVILFAVGLLGLTLLLRLPVLFRMIEQVGFDDDRWWLYLPSLVSLIAEAGLVYAIWIGTPWARWCLVGLALWGWGSTFWYAGSLFLTITAQSLLLDLQLLAEIAGLVLLYILPGSRWFQTMPNIEGNRTPHATTT